MRPGTDVSKRIPQRVSLHELPPPNCAVMRRAVFMLLALLLLGLALPARAGERGARWRDMLRGTRSQDEQRITLTVDGLTREYVAHVPPSYEAQTPMPVVIMLHGGGGTAEAEITGTGLTRKADAVGFLAVFPEGLRPHPERPAKFVGNPQTWNDGSGRFWAGE